jgi:hypothetical protein
MGPAHDVEAGAPQGLEFRRVVRQQADLRDAQIAQHLDRGGVAPQVVIEPEQAVRFHGVVTPLLQRVGLQLVQQTDAAALLAQVEHHAAARPDASQGRFQLRAAVAFQAAEDFAGQALAVDPDIDPLVTVDRTGNQRKVLPAGGLLEEAVDGEAAEEGGDLGPRDVRHGWRARFAHGQYPENSSVRMSSSSTAAETSMPRIAATIAGGPAT